MYGNGAGFCCHFELERYVRDARLASMRMPDADI